MTSNTMFYDGFEGEPEIVLTLVEHPEHPSEKLCIWEGYFDDIFAQPRFSSKGWRDFTKDYHELEGVWNLSDQTCLVLSVLVTIWQMPWIIHKRLLHSKKVRQCS